MAIGTTVLESGSAIRNWDERDHSRSANGPAQAMIKPRYVPSSPFQIKPRPVIKDAAKINWPAFHWNSAPFRGFAELR